MSSLSLYWNAEVAENELPQGGDSEALDKLCGFSHLKQALRVVI